MRENCVGGGSSPISNMFLECTLPPAAPNTVSDQRQQLLCGGTLHAGRKRGQRTVQRYNMFGLRFCSAAMSRLRRRAGRMQFHPGDVSVHPLLDELLVVIVDVAGVIEVAFLGVNENFGQAHSRNVKAGENIP